ncbi:hypothetical protein A3H16_01620 [Candidatus Kaiserbacteria bacterium RIFCSPLOWO2_12_FULL_53_8]|uniref:acylphosphatase n=1 Tax=Candidatus Kaiserbacteria bacterium RIFCSPLOWO2_12_FULL_53_8 TaxID=1798529 RepID=A0A1F6FZP7_9BACT|nr:MAG: hypothetical protein A3H16_01620 [Candidatus Kaiserbacteria bacterium RIFCSPLOWO2_12_FULL_53_8]
MPAIKLTITGHVQAVGFRAFVQKHAELLGLTGWVKNCEDGSVEVFAQGDEEKLNMLEQECKKGPAAAEVQQVVREELPPQPMDHFEIRH